MEKAIKNVRILTPSPQWSTATAPQKADQSLFMLHLHHVSPCHRAAAATAKLETLASILFLCQKLMNCVFLFIIIDLLFLNILISCQISLNLLRGWHHLVACYLCVIFLLYCPQLMLEINKKKLNHVALICLCFM